MIYFKVGTGNSAVDYSNHITSDNDYSVDQKNISYKWTDGLGGEHEKVYNTVIEGSLSLWFYSDGSQNDEFNAFLTQLNNSMSDGVLPVTLFVRNMNSEQSISINYEMTTKKFAKLRNNSKGIIVTLSIKQAAVYSNE